MTLCTWSTSSGTPTNVHKKELIQTATERKNSEKDGVFTLSTRRGTARTKGLVFLPHNTPLQVISGAPTVERDERATTKERMRFLLWS